MKTTKVTNISNENVGVVLADGTKINLPAHKSIEGGDVVNVSEIQSKVKMIRDLTEVNVGNNKAYLKG